MKDINDRLELLIEEVDVEIKSTQDYRSQFKKDSMDFAFFGEKVVALKAILSDLKEARESLETYKRRISEYC